MDRKHQDIDELLKQVMPQDLTKFGLIPEFIGRVPITVSLQTLNEEALVRILIPIATRLGRREAGVHG